MSKHRFKVGDRVLVVRGTSDASKKYSGQIAVIIKEHDNRPEWHYSIDIDFENGGIWDSDLQFAESYKSAVGKELLKQVAL